MTDLLKHTGPGTPGDDLAAFAGSSMWQNAGIPMESPKFGLLQKYSL